MEQLQSVLAQVEWMPRPWGQPVFDGDLIRDLKPGAAGQPSGGQALADVRFWKTVRQLDFAFENGDTRKVLDFYRQYGRVLHVTPAVQQLALEAVLAEPDDGDGVWVDAYTGAVEVGSEVRSWLRWFRLLTLVVEWVKQGKLEPLWEMVGGPRQLQASIVLAEASAGGPFLELPPIIRRRSPGAWSPATDAELVHVTWLAATQAVQEFLRLTPLVPARQSRPLRIFWSFRAEGALQAAFLQWFFAEFANVQAARCEARGCANIVLPPRKRFCSERCRQREKKRRQRERHVEEATFHG